MYAKHLLIFFIIYFASRGHGFKNGYSKETCDLMVPNREQGEPNVTISNSPASFEITISDKYRRNRDMNIVMNSNDVEGFQIQIRKFYPKNGKTQKSQRIGEFVKWPSTAQPLECDEGKYTSVTHKDLKNKKNLTFTWRAPEEKEGWIKVYDAYVLSDGEYWADVCDIKLDVAKFPVFLKDCGEQKSCVRYSSNADDCDGNTCNYLLTYQINETDVVFSLGTLSNVTKSYVAVGFSETKDKNIHLTACIREDMGSSDVSIRNYILESEGELPTKKTEDVQNAIVDKEGHNFWCEFTRPLKGAGGTPLEFDKDLYWIYAWGEMNETTNMPILGSNWHQSRENVKQTINKIHYTKDSSSISMANFVLIFLSSVLTLHITQI